MNAHNLVKCALEPDARRHAVPVAVLSVAALLVARAAFAQLISNGGFEDGLPSGSPPAQWQVTGDFFHWTNPSKAHTGSQYAYFGIAADGTTPLTNGSGSIQQSIPFIADTPPMTLTFWLWVASDEPSSPAYDHLYVEVLGDSGALLATLAEYLQRRRGRSDSLFGASLPGEELLSGAVRQSADSDTLSRVNRCGRRDDIPP